MARQNLLMLVQRLPFPPNKGEKIRSYNILKHLSEDYAVHLGTLMDDPADWAHVDALRPLVASLKVVGIRKPLAFANMALRWPFGTPLSFGYFQSPQLQAWVNATVARVKPDIAVLYSSNIATYLEASGYRPPVWISDFVDLDSQKWLDYVPTKTIPMRWLYAEEAQRVQRAEQRIARASDAITFVSDDESALFRTACPAVAHKVHAVGNGVDIQYFSPTYIPPATAGPEQRGARFVFTGTMDYWPNIEAVFWFAEQVWPQVYAQYPDARFQIVGGKPTAAVQALANRPGVEVTGRVADVRPYLARATVCIAPMQIARGIQNKVLEGMAMGKPMIVTTGALTGIPAQANQHVLVATGPAEWQEACTTLLRDPGRASALGVAGRDLVVRAFSWSAQLARLDQLITQQLRG